MRVAWVMIAMSIVGAAGCAVGRRPDRSRFFTLSALEAEPSASSGRQVVGLGPVTLPGYLHRPHLVERDGDAQVDFSENDRWGEPLPDGVLRVLALGIERHAGVDVERYPWASPGHLTTVVAVDVSRFERQGDAVILDAEWRIGPHAGAGSRRAFTWHEPVAADDDGAVDAAVVVAAMNRALDAFSRTIAAAVPRARSERPAPSPHAEKAS